MFSKAIPDNSMIGTSFAIPDSEKKRMALMVRAVGTVTGRIFTGEEELL